MKKGFRILKFKKDKPIFEVKDVSKSFDGRPILKKLSLKVYPGECVGVLGPNGCGKTTTIGMILGLIRPTKGQVLINNKDIEIEKNRISVLEKMNFISPYVELPKKLSVKENLIVYGKMYEVKNLQNRINTLCNDLNLKEFLNKKTGELSSGQKNRVSLAKSLINNPEILLLDEPTASLDPDTGDYVRSYIENYAKKNNTTILLASHNMSEVERLCENIMMMKQGKIIDEGTCEELISKHGRVNLEETFLKLVRE